MPMIWRNQSVNNVFNVLVVNGLETDGKDEQLNVQLGFAGFKSLNFSYSVARFTKFKL